MLAEVGAAGPAGGDQAVEVGAALGRRALDQRQQVGREDRDPWPVARRDGRVDGGAVEQMPPALGPGDRPDQAMVSALRRLDLRLGPGERLPCGISSRRSPVRNERPVSAK